LGGCETNWPSPAKCDSLPSEARPSLPFCFSITNNLAGVKYGKKGTNKVRRRGSRAALKSRSDVGGGRPVNRPYGCPTQTYGTASRGIAPTNTWQFWVNPRVHPNLRRMAARGRPLRSATNLGSPKKLRRIRQILLMLRGMSGAISQTSAPPIVSRTEAISIKRG